tara:strand:- start:426 stop:1106 length:681 start_codon:yes stop_codon:yes gene_type:complete
MNVFQTTDIENLVKYPRISDQLAIVKREKPEGSDIFFEKLMKNNLSVIGKVTKKNSIEDIKYLLEGNITNQLKNDPFYFLWISDMSQVCKLFSIIINSESVDFCLSTGRGCRRFHIDHVPMRLLVTYAGKGTEWIPDEAADRIAFANGAPNEKIIKDPLKRNFMNTWDISIFHGGPNGLLHRTPDAALNKKSILLRLDHSSYWEKILKQNDNSVMELGVRDTKAEF